MQTAIAKVFISGNSQAIRLPKQFRVDAKEVFVRWQDNGLLITPRPDSWKGFMQGCEGLSDDFPVKQDSLPADSERLGFD